MTLRLKQALVIVIGIVVALGMLGLGLWQMSRYRQSSDDVAQQRLALEAVSLVDSVSTDGTVADIYGRRVTLEGSLLRGDEVLVGTEAPYRVAAPVELTDGRYVAVVLGTADSEVSLDGISEGPLELVGVFTASDKGVSATADTELIAGRIETLRLQSLAQVWPSPLISGYVTLEGDPYDLGLPAAEVLLPEAEGTAMHQGYALQWWVFAGAAIAFSIFVARGLGRGSKSN